MTASPGDTLPAGTVPAEAATPETAAASRPQSMRFRRKFTAVRLTPEQADRQGRIATGAYRSFGDRERAMAFLNGHDDTLGGRPLDLAIASAEGLAACEAALAAQRG